jgi:hypothetical protein
VWPHRGSWRAMTIGTDEAEAHLVSFLLRASR